MNFFDFFHIFTAIVTGIAISGFIFYGVAAIQCRKLRKNVFYIHAEQDGWLDIEKSPIPDCIECSFNGLLSQRILISDGQDVEVERILTYDRNGKIMMSLNGPVAKYWRPLPEPPKGKKDE